MSHHLDIHSTEDMLINVPGEGVLLKKGATVPSDAETGYMKGCLFIDTANGKLYINVGTKASANFDELDQVVAPAAALTAADGGTVDNTYGQDENDVITNNVVRIDEIEAALIAHGILTAP